MKHCVYLHAKPETITTAGIFYVGKGSSKRAKRLDKGQRNVFHGRVVEKYGAKNILIGLIECSSDAIAIDLEIGLIKCLRRNGTRLCNLTDGGEGAKGLFISEESKAKMSAAKIGKKLSEDHKRKISEALKVTTRTPEHRAKVSEASKGRVMSEEAKKKISISHMGMRHSPEVIEKIASKRRGVPLGPQSEETKQKISMAHKMRFAKLKATQS